MFALTKDGRIYKYNELDHSIDNVLFERFIKESKTLKGLCDCFVIIEESGHKSVWTNVFMENKPCHIKVFGMIWIESENGVPILRPIIELTKRGNWKTL